jgi:genome maintenance exonuclease 1
MKRWRDKVGAEEANRISKESTTRGTKIHALAEKYLLAVEPVDASGLELHEVPFWLSLKPALAKIGHIWTEKFLYHDGLKYAGTADCYGIVNGKRTIIDFKTSSKPKQEGWIKDYQLQIAAYGAAVWERSQQPIEQGLILIALSGQPAQQFLYTKDDLLGFWGDWKDRVNQFYGNF